MAQSAPQVFSGITPENFATLIEKAQSAGLNLTGNSGKATKFGVEMAWNYSAVEQQLTIQCLATPFFVKPEQVNAKIQALMKETLAQGCPSAG
jgi:hypothetical protein